MRYFRMKAHPKIRNCTTLAGFGGGEAMGLDLSDGHRIKSLSVVEVRGGGDSVTPDWLEVPVPLIKEVYAELLMAYEDKLLLRPVMFNHRGRMVQERYQMVLAERVPCVHGESESYPNGAVKRLILDSDKIRGRNLFKVQGTSTEMVVVSLDLAESLLRRDCYGILFEEIECREV